MNMEEIVVAQDGWEELGMKEVFDGWKLELGGRGEAQVLMMGWERLLTGVGRVVTV